MAQALTEIDRLFLPPCREDAELVQVVGHGRDLQLEAIAITAADDVQRFADIEIKPSASGDLLPVAAVAVRGHGYADVLFADAKRLAGKSVAGLLAGDAGDGLGAGGNAEVVAEGAGDGHDRGQAAGVAEFGRAHVLAVEVDGTGAGRIDGEGAVGVIVGYDFPASVVKAPAKRSAVDGDHGRAHEAVVARVHEDVFRGHGGIAALAVNKCAANLDAAVFGPTGVAVGREADFAAGETDAERFVAMAIDDHAAAILVAQCELIALVSAIEQRRRDVPELTVGIDVVDFSDAGLGIARVELLQHEVAADGSAHTADIEQEGRVAEGQRRAEKAVGTRVNFVVGATE